MHHFNYLLHLKLPGYSEFKFLMLNMQNIEITVLSCEEQRVLQSVYTVSFPEGI